MKLKHAPFLMIAMAFTACQWDKPVKTIPAITTDTLKYTYKAIKQRAADCGNRPDSACTVANIVYPIFDAQTALNNTVNSNLLSQVGLGEKPDSSLQQLLNHYFILYNGEKANGHNADMFYILSAKVYVVRQDSSLLTLQFSEEGYFGGAHGNMSTTFLNWNTKSAKKITLNDILADGYEEQLNQIAETIFRKDEKLTPTAPLSPDYFFDKGKFKLNNNFMITPLGLRFLYNEYEIKPYSAGQTGLNIPYSEIRSLLRPNTVVTQYIK